MDEGSRLILLAREVAPGLYEDFGFSRISLRHPKLALFPFSLVAALTNFLFTDTLASLLGELSALSNLD